MFDLYHNPRLTTVWLAAGRPCQQPWLPLHPLCGLPDALAPMADPAAELARHLCPDPSRMAHGNSGWQRLRDFGNEMGAVYGDNAEAVRAALADQRVRAARADAEAVARADALFAQGRVEEASAVLGALVRAAGVRGAGDGCFAGEGFSPRAGLRSGGGGWRALARRFRGRRCGGPRARRAHSRDGCLRGHSGCGKPAARRLPDARARLLRSGASRQLCRRGGWDLHRAVRRAHGAWLCDGRASTSASLADGMAMVTPLRRAFSFHCADGAQGFRRFFRRSARALVPDVFLSEKERKAPTTAKNAESTVKKRIEIDK